MHPPPIAPPGGGEYGRRFGLTAMRAPEDGSIELDFDVKPEHLQDFGVLHGGAVMALLDMAMGACVMRTLSAAELTATESMVTDFMKGVRGGRITARAWIERRGRTTAFPRGELRNEQGELVARATGVWAIRPK